LNHALSVVFFMGENMEKVLMLGLAGALGTLCRYWLSILAHSVIGVNFPWGTWLVNITGCLVFGLVWTLGYERGLIPAHLRLVILVGFLGAFTTFSTYIFENSALVQEAQWFKMGINILGQNAAGFLALYLGYVAGKAL